MASCQSRTPAFGEIYSISETESGEGSTTDCDSGIVDSNTTCDTTDPNFPVMLMLNRVAYSGAHFKHQQRDEPDLTHIQKLEIANDILSKNPATFLSRFGKYLAEEDLLCFDGQCGDYMIDYQLKEIRKHLVDKNNQIKVRNRRYEAMKKMMLSGDYFSEDEMKWRNPLLYEQMVGQHLTDDDIQAKIDKSDLSFSSILLNHIAVQHTNALYEHQKDKQESQMEESDEDSSEESELEEDDGIKPSEAERLQMKQEFLKIMQESFLDGKDAEFDYSEVDGNEEFDSIDIREKDEEENYFDKDDSDSENKEFDEMRVTTMMESDCSLHVSQDCLDTVSKATVDETNMDVDSASTELSNRDCIDNTHEKCSVPNEKHVDGEPIEKT